MKTIEDAIGYDYITKEYGGEILMYDIDDLSLAVDCLFDDVGKTEEILINIGRSGLRRYKQELKDAYEAFRKQEEYREKQEGATT